MKRLQMLREIVINHQKHNQPLPLKIVLSYEDFYQLILELAARSSLKGNPFGIHEAEIYGMRVTDPDGEINERP